VSHSLHPLRIVLVGTGTSVGKTWVATELLRELQRRGVRAIGLKPIESGVTEGSPTDAEQLAHLSSTSPATPPYRFAEPISPHLAARRAGVGIELDRALTYVQAHESSSPGALVVETAGGLFSPLSESTTCFELARALDPARWVLVAADALGVIHDVMAALLAAKARGRAPDLVVLSAARASDASTGSNAAELARLGIVPRPFALGRNDSAGISALVDALLAPAAIPHGGPSRSDG
jgi:dethiobiotin synthetase